MLDWAINLKWIGWPILTLTMQQTELKAGWNRPSGQHRKGSTMVFSHAHKVWVKHPCWTWLSIDTALDVVRQIFSMDVLRTGYVWTGFLPCSYTRSVSYKKLKKSNNSSLMEYASIKFIEVLILFRASCGMLKLLPEFFIFFIFFSSFVYQSLHIYVKNR